MSAVAKNKKTQTMEKPTPRPNTPNVTVNKLNKMNPMKAIIANIIFQGTIWIQKK